MDQNPNSNPLFQLFQSVFPSQAAANAQNNAAASSSATPTEGTSGVNARHPVDAHMANGEYDDMPGLQEMSDSESEADSDRHDHEVEMQSADDIAMQHSASSERAPTPSVLVNNNRRARVEDDDDEERDRRHPSQRVSSAVNTNTASPSVPTPNVLPHNLPHTHTSASTTPSSTAPQPPPQRPRSTIQRHVFHTTINLGNGGPANMPFNLLRRSNSNLALNNNNTDNNNTGNPNADVTMNAGAANTAGPNPPNPTQDGANARRHQLFGGMLSFDLGPGGLLLPQILGGAGPPGMPFPAGLTPDNNNPNAQQPGNAQPQAGQLPPQLGDLLERIGIQVLRGAAGLGLGAENMEDPERAKKLVDGLEVVPEGLVRRLERVGGTGGGMGEESTAGGDSGCAICWDRLLDTDGAGFGATASESVNSSETQVTQPKIVSLPCAHVFHADCLIPWFSRPRQTTCPTCRFNIDPDNLTYVSWQRRQRERREAEAAAAGTEAPADGPPVAAGAGAAAPAGPDEATATAAERDDIFREFANFYSTVTGNGTPAAAAQDQQPQGEQQQQQRTTLPFPSVTIQSIPLTIPIPVAFPSGAGVDMRHMAPNETAFDNSAPASGSTQPAQASQSEARQQPPSQSGTMAGEYARLFARLGRPSHIPVPLDALFPPVFRHLGTPESSQGNPPNAQANAAGPFAQARRFTLDPLGNLQPLPPMSAAQGPAAGDNPTASTAQPTPQGNANPFNIPGMNFGVPGMRADVVVTMDMFFDPRGPGADPHDDDNGAPEEQHEDVNMADDMMEGQDEQRATEMANFRAAILRLLASTAGRNNNNNNANTNANPQPQPQPQPQEENTAPAVNAPPPPIPGTTNTNGIPSGPGNRVHFATGSGASMGEAFAQLLARMSGAPPPPPQGAQATSAEQHANEEPLQDAQHGVAADAPPPPHAHTPRVPRVFPPITGLFNPFPNIFGGPFPPRAPRREGPKPAWTLPAAPGLTLRQRVERREREAGLRCYDVSCGLGPSDEEPFTDKVSETVSAMKQLSIRHKDEAGGAVCDHRFHSACLVSAERVALKGADAVVDDGRVDVVCPVCRTSGCVTKEEWNEGVDSLA